LLLKNRWSITKKEREGWLGDDTAGEMGPLRTSQTRLVHQSKKPRGERLRPRSSRSFSSRAGKEGSFRRRSGIKLSPAPRGFNRGGGEKIMKKGDQEILGKIKARSTTSGSKESKGEGAGKGRRQRTGRSIHAASKEHQKEKVARKSYDFDAIRKIQVQGKNGWKKQKDKKKRLCLKNGAGAQECNRSRGTFERTS